VTITLLTALFILLTIGAYALSRAVAKRYPSPFTTPVFFSTTLIVLVLVAGGIPYTDYQPAADLIATVLGPATVALAVPIHRHRRILLGALMPALAGIVIGVLVTIGVALVLGRLFGFDEQLQLALTVKSTTAPVALELTRIIGGSLQLAAALVIATGMVGAMFGQWLMDRTGIDHPLARGLAMGTVSHGQGTAQAVIEGELQGAIAAVAMGLAAIVTTIVAPPIVAAFL
jgi:putative effector of murein hydrolase